MKIKLMWITRIFGPKALANDLAVVDKVIGNPLLVGGIASFIGMFNPAAQVLFLRIAASIHKAATLIPPPIDANLSKEQHDKQNAERHAIAVGDIMDSLTIGYMMSGKEMTPERMAQRDKAISGMKEVMNFMEAVHGDLFPNGIPVVQVLALPVPGAAI